MIFINESWNFMKTLTQKVSLLAFVSTIVFISGFTNVFAEDIEIYDRIQTEPNVLFILDQSESMLELVGSTGLTRDQIVKQAFQQVMSQTYNNLNVGFMDYGRNNGAGVDLPVADVNELARNIEPNVVSTTETYASMLSRFVANVEGPQPNAKTATVEALLEAAKYYRGEILDNKSQGYQGPPGIWNDGDSDYWDSVTGSGNSHWRAAGPRTYSGGSWQSSSTPGPYGPTCKTTNIAGVSLPVCTNPWPGSCWNVPYQPPVNNPFVPSHPHGSKCIDPPGYGCLLWNVDNTECVTSGCLGGTEPAYYHTHAASTTPEVPAHTRCKETGTSTSTGFNGDRFYISPIQTACTENFIVLLSDGGPTILGNHEQTSIKNIAGISSCENLSAAGFNDPSIQQKGVCGPDLVKALANDDQASGVTGIQTINTYTVGFDLGAGASEAKDYLQKLATDGNGQFFDANGAGGVSGLVNIFQNIFNSITQKPLTVARVGSTIDVSTLSSSRDELYVPTFAAAPGQPRWPGNLKGYTMDPAGFLKGLDNNPAFTTAGDFNPSSRSYWSASADGGSIESGGVASRLYPSVRNLYTDDGPGTSRSFEDLIASNFDENDVALFGLVSTGDDDDDEDMVQEHVEWVRGVDVDDENSDGSSTDSRNFIGDALHTDPVVANYDGSKTDPVVGGSIDRVVYFMTNEGFIHAINVTGNTDTTGGTELFAYMPSDLLPNTDLLRRDVGGGAKVYGLDGPLTLHQVGGLTNVAGKKYLYFGMRRGGMNYYAMDVTDPLSPSLMWVIEGGTGDFKEMAQSWSKPIVTNVDVGGTKTLALVFGGGYDTTQDSATTYTADIQGRAIYIVDAITGDKIWSAGPNTLTPNSPDTHNLDLALANGIAGDVSVIDLDNDTYADRIYFGDIGGSIWRIDIQGDLNGLPGFLNDYSGYEFANLHGNSTTDNRRFFGRPIAALTQNGKLAVSIGSGHRSHPLDPNVQDRFYTLYDPNVNGVPTSAPSAVTESNLQDITGFTSGYTNSSMAGWRFDLGVGEKVFNEASVLRGEIFFSTYVPPATVCSNDPNGSRLFVLDLEGNASRDLDGDVSNGKDFFITVNNFGILPKMALHYGSTGQVRSVFLPNVGNVYSTGILEDRFWTNNP